MTEGGKGENNDGKEKQERIARNGKVKQSIWGRIGKRNKRDEDGL